MKVISPETKIDVRHFLSNELIERKKKAEAAIIAIHPIKNVKFTGSLTLPVTSAISGKNKFVIFSKFLLVLFEQIYNFLVIKLLFPVFFSFTHDYLTIFYENYL